ncbi:MAG: flavodoxin [Candidatus Thermoplasmatota archaeon]|nr:flavodoxin [Candidatus Thermoplasmatota archaeon]
MPKALVVYYSLEGNTRFIAENIAAEIGADIFELKTKKQLPGGFLKYIIGGFQAVSKKTPEILPIEKKLEDYEMVFIGTPVWAGKYAPAVRTFIKTFNLEGKNVAIFCCHGDSKERALSLPASDLGKCKIAGRIDFQQPLDHGKDAAAKEVRQWAKKMV